MHKISGEIIIALEANDYEYIVAKFKELDNTLTSVAFRHVITGIMLERKKKNDDEIINYCDSYRNVLFSKEFKMNEDGN